jgi:fibronectin type 3 domain-containing protein
VLFDTVGNVTDYNDTQVTYGTSYFYSVAAKNLRGVSARSEIKSGIPGAVPDPVVDLASTTRDRYVNLSWKAPAYTGGLNILGYKIYKGPSATSLTFLNETRLLDFGDRDVQNAVDYFYAVTAYNLVGESKRMTIAVFPCDVPSAPTLSMDAGQGYISLTWTKSDDHGLAIQGYKVYRGKQPTTFVQVQNVSGLNFKDTDVEIGVRYYYSITAVNQRGEGPRSNIMNGSAQGLPGQPVGLQLRAGDGFVLIQWNAPMNTGGLDITSYNIYRGVQPTSLTALTSRPVGTYNDTSVTNGITYFYSITAVNGIGEGDQAPTKSARPAGLPGPVIALKLLSSDGNMHITWEKPKSTGGLTISGYKIYKGETKDSLTYLTNVTTLVYDDKWVINGKPYYYQVTAVNDVGEGTRSDLVTTTAGGPPSAPTDLKISRKDNGVLLEWSPPAKDGGFALKEYRIYRSTGDGGYALIKTTGDTKFKDTSVGPGKKYDYKVCAVNEKGEGAPSDIKTIQTASSATSLVTTMIIVIILIIVVVIVICIVMLKFRKGKKSATAQVQEQQPALPQTAELPPPPSPEYYQQYQAQQQYQDPQQYQYQQQYQDPQQYQDQNQNHQ